MHFKNVPENAYYKKAIHGFQTFFTSKKIYLLILMLKCVYFKDRKRERKRILPYTGHSSNVQKDQINSENQGFMLGLPHYGRKKLT